MKLIRALFTIPQSRPAYFLHDQQSRVRLWSEFLIAIPGFSYSQPVEFRNIRTRR